MKRGKKGFWRSVFRWLCVCLLVLFLPTTVWAAGESEYPEAGDTSLTMHYKLGAGSFSFYKVAAFSETGVFTMEDPFTEYTGQIEELNRLDSLDTQEWQVLASTLEGIVQQMEPFYRADTDEAGNLVWEGIPKGLYLITGETTQDEERIYTPNPILVTVPNRDVDGNWNCHVVIEHNKIGEEEIPEGPVSYEVVKVWKDTGYEKQRPESITVELLKDGSRYDTVTLSQENNWRYIWDELEAGHEWKVNEPEVPDGYTKTVTQEGTAFVITNTYHKPGTTVPNQNTKLPQTGQLWWPVPLMAFLGIVAFMIGWVWRREQDA